MKKLFVLFIVALLLVSVVSGTTTTIIFSDSGGGDPNSKFIDTIPRTIVSGSPDFGNVQKYIALAEDDNKISIFDVETQQQVDSGVLTDKQRNVLINTGSEYVWVVIWTKSGKSKSTPSQSQVLNTQVKTPSGEADGFSLNYEGTPVLVLNSFVDERGRLSVDPKEIWGDDWDTIIRGGIWTSRVPDGKLINIPEIDNDLIATKIFPGKVGTDIEQRELASKFDFKGGLSGPLVTLLLRGFQSEEGLGSYVATVARKGLNAVAKVTQRASVNILGANNKGAPMFQSNVPVAGMLESKGGKYIFGKEFGLLASQVSELDPDGDGEFTLLSYENGKELKVDLEKGCSKLSDKSSVSISKSGILSYKGSGEKPQGYFLAIQNEKTKKFHYLSQSGDAKVRVNGASKNSFAFHGTSCSKLTFASSSGGGSGSSGGQPSIPFEPSGGTVQGGENGGDDQVITYTYGLNVIPTVVQTPDGDADGVLILEPESREFDVAYSEGVQGTPGTPYNGTVSALFAGNWEVGLDQEEGGYSLFLENIYYHSPNIEILTSRGVNSVVIGLDFKNVKEEVIGTATFTLDLTERAPGYVISLDSAETYNSLYGVSINFGLSGSNFKSLYGLSGGASVSSEEVVVTEDDFVISYTPPAGGGSRGDSPLEGFAD